jgi:EpsI family protein
MNSNNHLSIKRAGFVTFIMVISVIFSYMFTPRIDTEITPPDLETIIPKKFGNWRADENLTMGIINPQVKETLTRVYTKTLTRTYVNEDGHRIMLSLAYGSDQSGENRVHRPEVCYPAQGFMLLSSHKDTINVNGIEVPVMRMIAEAGARQEPITYWIRVGNTIVRGSIEQAFSRIKFGFKGRVPDGLLFRVSEVNREAEKSFEIQNSFIINLIENISPEGKRVILGS